MPLDVTDFEAQRPTLMAIAYRMLGSASEAEDVVQDAYLRAAAAPGEVRAPRAFLATVVTRLCLDRLKSARAAREQYIGPWLPEPVLAEPSGGAGEEQAERAETVAMAVLVLLEQLSPLERAVFLLHGSFEFSFEEVGGMIGRTPAACRQAYHRAREHIDARRPRFRAAPEEQRRLVEGFLAAAREGDLAALTAALSEKVTFVGDGGGAVVTARRPVVGADSVARLIAGLAAKGAGLWASVRFALEWVNGEPGLLAWEAGRLTNVLIFSVGPDGISAIYNVRNPAKLAHLEARAGWGT